MKNILRFLLAIGLSLSPLACSTKVLGGGTGAEPGDDTGTGARAAGTGAEPAGNGGEPAGNGGSPTGSGGEPASCGTGGEIGGPPSEPAAIAMLASQVFWYTGTGGEGTASSSSGGGVDPNTLFIMVGTPAPACHIPLVTFGCGLDFEVSIGIPPELQQPGTLSLTAPGMISTFSESGPESGGGNCFPGGGSFKDGTIEIVSIDDTQVVFTLGGTMMLTGQGVPDEVANGTYVAARCQ